MEEAVKLFNDLHSLWIVHGDSSKDPDGRALAVTIDKTDGRILWIGLESKVQ